MAYSFGLSIRTALFASLMLVICVGDAGSQAMESMVILEDFKLPDYGEDGSLRVVIYGGRARSEGVLIHINDLLVDFVRSDITDVDKVKDIKGLKLYDIGTPVAEVVEFWAGNTHTQALLGTGEASINRTSQTVSGDGEVRLRSALMDIDGRGFDADYPNQNIHIREDVKVILRSGMSEAGLAPDLLPRP